MHSSTEDSVTAKRPSNVEMMFDPENFQSLLESLQNLYDRKKICRIDAKPIPKFVSDNSEQLWFFLFSGRGGEDTRQLVL